MTPRLGRDWFTAEASWFRAEFEVNALRSDYWYDWQFWRADEGAETEPSDGTRPRSDR